LTVIPYRIQRPLNANKRLYNREVPAVSHAGEREKAHKTYTQAFTLPRFVMLTTLEDNNRAIISTSWMIIFSIIPPDLVRTGTILLGTVILVVKVTHHFRPCTLIQTLQLRLLSLEEKLQNTIDSGIMAQSDEIFTAQIERSMGRSVSTSSTTSMFTTTRSL